VIRVGTRGSSSHAERVHSLPGVAQPRALTRFQFNPSGVGPKNCKFAWAATKRNPLREAQISTPFRISKR